MGKTAVMLDREERIGGAANKHVNVWRKGREPSDARSGASESTAESSVAEVCAEEDVRQRIHVRTKADQATGATVETSTIPDTTRARSRASGRSRSVSSISPMKRTLRLVAFTALALTVGRVFAADTKTNTLTPAEKSAGWVLLFDGKTLNGWRASEHKGAFTVEDGCIVTFGDMKKAQAEGWKRSHLFYVGSLGKAEFKNFELSLDIKAYAKGNSGVYIHTEYQETGWPDKGYEIQVNNTHKDVKKGAGLYAVKDNLEAPAKDEEWYTMVVKVQGKRIQTFVNGKQIVDFTEPTPAAPPPKMAGRKLSSGTIALQAHDAESKVMYKNIKIRPLP